MAQNRYLAFSKIRFNSWTIYLVIIVLAIAIPLLSIFFGLFKGPGDSWNHIQNTVLFNYVTNSLMLTIGIGALTILTGVSTAWFVSTCEFPGRKFFEWALILPLAIPSYIIAYTYAGIFDFAGPLQILYRRWFPDQPFTFDIMNIYGVIILLSFVLYPYVYATARAAFINQSAAIIESGRVLGCSPWKIFYKLVLPLSRPAIIAGVSLVIMEVLNDYGAVKYFGVPTFTTGIFRAWFSLGDVQSAIFLSALLMGFVLLFLGLEQIQRGGRKYDQITGASNSLARFQLQGIKRLAVCIVCLTPLLLGFVVPVLQLGFWSFKTFRSVMGQEFWQMILNSFSVAGITALLSVLVALILAYAVKLNGGYFAAIMTKVANIGYAIPGAVIAVGIMIPVLSIDKFLIKGLERLTGNSLGLIISGSLFMLIFAYLVRFLVVAFNPTEEGFKKIGWQLTEAARTLGFGPFKCLVKINIPLMKGALLSGALLVFVDVLKELPLTLILRPFNFHTLATKAFELASDEMVAESANAALIIVLTGIIPIIVLSKLISRNSLYEGATD
ncbi:iron ABC transporter permease [Fulvivirgaceae bacterium BMA12]|uniref:Iron ABC transporter permease n=1 Tax=Agaribacillus aureus TaxID=3051825 RepID=A0ABT8LIJ9_9BACT|nr:iron ABC transporter permease [Fulvivirgaceae bacterium BMA12]